MPWYKRLMSVDRRILYIILFIGITFPMFSPIGLPIPEDEIAGVAYEYLANLPVGSNILFSFDTSSSGITEIKPSTLVLADLSFSKGHNVMTMALWAEGNAFASDWLDPVAEKWEAKYGENFIHLGFVINSSSFMDAARTDLYEAFNGGVDKFGKKLTDFPLMKDITKAKDIDLVISLNSGDPGPTAWVANWGSTEGVKIMSSCTSVSNPEMVNKYQSGLMVGNVGGLAGAAYIEKLHGTLGSATGGMDSQSLGHVTILVFIILGNIGYFGAKRAGEMK